MSLDNSDYSDFDTDSIFRYAVVIGDPERVGAYLPGNYKVVGTFSNKGRVYSVVAGFDNAGWTLDGYVLPRLMSGVMPARELHLAKQI